ncbi:putative quinol monooxygenase [Silvimonas amylolytica]|uniref:Quinol monooxygenase YgiN n=1 Tax=Silvimonas amylolytica TaxID=449663 RepID=A0ABQ2PI34_9NEIS|nr:putative quinol monooxygenase [Silvimonas amylolytica]GGP25272.1 putative quinol monooxygenase YgiN [Silvimonas amylolytica]
MLTVIAIIKAKPGQREKLLAEFAKIVPAVLAEEGCTAYAPMVDAVTQVAFQTTSPDTVFMLEQWATIEHLQAHMKAPHMLTYREATKDLVESASIHILNPGL